MKIEIAKESGFCFGVRKAVELAMRYADADTFSYGKIIHNDLIVGRLEARGLRVVDSLEGLSGGRLIIRSHGAGKAVYDEAKLRGIEVVDATCPFVKHIHEIVRDHYADGYQIVIIGKNAHPEVVGINGWCENSAIIIDDPAQVERLNGQRKMCLVVQTTFSVKKYREILKKIPKDTANLVEIFDTICYTTNERQSEAENLAKKCDIMLVIGSKSSSNTNRLYELCRTECENTYLVSGLSDLKNLECRPDSYIGITAGASTPEESIMEVREYMSEKFGEVSSQEFLDAVEESPVSYREGQRVKGTVINAEADGIHVNIGGKKDGLIRAEDVNLDGTYDPKTFESGSEIEAVIIAKQDDSGCILLSKKRVDEIIEGDKFVETIRNGEVFEMTVRRDTKGGLLGKIGTYTIFVPASLIKEKGSFVKNLKDYINKKLRLTALEIDDEKHKIVASQQAVLMAEKKEREEIFWTHVQPGVVVSGVVKRITDFGAFVSVDGFDCLAHIVDLSWTHINKVEDVLQIGKSYDFLVLKVDQEKSRVSLGYKQLQKHPYVEAMEKHPIGSVVKGKVTSIVTFGAFVEIEPGVEGLVHVSEAARNFIKSMNEVVKVGDEVEVMLMNFDEEHKKITLSMKACLPEDSADSAPVEKEEKKPAKARASKSAAPSANAERKEWSEDAENNPFADLLKNIDINEK